MSVTINIKILSNKKIELKNIKELKNRLKFSCDKILKFAIVFHIIIIVFHYNNMESVIYKST